MPTNCGLKSELRAADGRLTIASTMSLSRISSVVLFLFLAPSLWAQNPHPRIWLDSTTMARLTALKNANDATWVALKADADSYASATVEAWSASNCASHNDICYVYRGSGWYDSVLPLALAYQMTGSAIYSNQVKAVLNAFVAAGTNPCSASDQGYNARYAIVALAIGYDWIYPTLSSTDKVNYTSTLDACWTIVQTGNYGYEWTNSPYANGYGNFFGGILEGFGLAGIAVEGDDINSASIQAQVLSNFNTYLVPALSAGGGFQGGFATQGYNYGGPNFVRISQYMLAMQTAGKTNLYTTYHSWLKAIAKNTIYEMRPDLWAINDEGDWPNSVVRTLYRAIPNDLAGILNGTTEGGELQYLYAHATSPPDGISTATFPIAPANWETFLYNTGQSTVDYTAALPTYYFSPGDNHTFVRTDWSTSATYTQYNGGAVNWVQDKDHVQNGAGNIEIQRGADYLLVNAVEWAGRDGVTGSPSGGGDLSSWLVNTLAYDDQNTYCRAETRFHGCQMGLGSTVVNAVVHNEGTGFAFQKSDLRPIYFDGQGNTTITDYHRSFVNINGISFVFDRISAPSTSVRKLYWHMPNTTGSIVPGNSSATSLAGALGTVTVGASKLWIDTLLPTSPTITQAADPQGWMSSTIIGTQSLAVVDPAAGSCSTNCLFLTVLAPTASGSQAPTFTLISATGYKGALYNDAATPRVALFSVDGTSHTSVIYTASYSSGLTGRHVIVDLMPGTYNVTEDGTTLYAGLTVGTDGSLSFTATGGTAYSITQIGGPPAATPPQPPTGLSGTVR
jgi:hypothetical protein